MMLRLIPKIFRSPRAAGLDLFADSLGFEVVHQDDTLAVIERDGATAYLVESSAEAAEENPELAIETDAIDECFAEIRARRPEMLQGELPEVTEQPTGAREFVVKDKQGTRVVFRQW